MNQFPEDPKKIRQRIRRYERLMRKEYEEHGFISDGYGKRYLLGALYLLMDDVEGALASFQWFEKMFPDDMGDPIHYLCWALTLYRLRDLEDATFRLRQAMLSNLYLIPRLVGEEQEELDIPYNTHLAHRLCLDYIPPEVFELWDEDAVEWARKTYESPELQRIRSRYIEIERRLKTEPRGPNHSELVDERIRSLRSRDLQARLGD